MLLPDFSTEEELKKELISTKLASGRFRDYGYGLAVVFDETISGMNNRLILREEPLVIRIEKMKEEGYDVTTEELLLSELRWLKKAIDSK